MNAGGKKGREGEGGLGRLQLSSAPSLQFILVKKKGGIESYTRCWISFTHVLLCA
jgi:hypothetical protein